MKKFHNSNILLNANSFTTSLSIDGKAVRNYSSIIQVPSVKILSRDNVDYKLQVVRSCIANIGDEKVSLREGDIIKAHLDNTSFYVIECVRPNPVKRHRRTVVRRSFARLFPDFVDDGREYHAHSQRVSGARVVSEGYGFIRLESSDDDWQYLDRDL